MAILHIKEVRANGGALFANCREANDALSPTMNR